MKKYILILFLISQVAFSQDVSLSGQVGNNYFAMTDKLNITEGYLFWCYTGGEEIDQVVIKEQRRIYKSERVTDIMGGDFLQSGKYVVIVYFKGKEISRSIEFEVK